jgi:hypothetical protein
MSAPTNCINCGAPLKGAACEYCGTVFPGIFNDTIANIPPIVLQKDNLKTICISWNIPRAEILPGKALLRAKSAKMEIAKKIGLYLLNNNLIQFEVIDSNVNPWLVEVYGTVRVADPKGGEDDNGA